MVIHNDNDSILSMRISRNNKDGTWCQNPVLFQPDKVIMVMFEDVWVCARRETRWHCITQITAMCDTRCHCSWLYPFSWLKRMVIFRYMYLNRIPMYCESVNAPVLLSRFIGYRDACHIILIKAALRGPDDRHLSTGHHIWIKVWLSSAACVYSYVDGWYGPGTYTHQPCVKTLRTWLNEFAQTSSTHTNSVPWQPMSITATFLIF